MFYWMFSIHLGTCWVKNEPVNVTFSLLSLMWNSAIIEPAVLRSSAVNYLCHINFCVYELWRLPRPAVCVWWKSYGRLSLTSTGEFTGKIKFRRNVMKKKKRMIIHIREQVCVSVSSTAMCSYVSLVWHHIMWMCCSTAAEQCLDEPCDTYSIEQTDRGFRCAIDVPSVLYKLVYLLDHSHTYVSQFPPWVITTKKVTLT